MDLYSRGQGHSIPDTNVNVERFVGLNICGFSPMKFSWKYFCSALDTSVHYLPIAKISWGNFCGKLKNREKHECLAK